MSTEDMNKFVAFISAFNGAAAAYQGNLSAAVAWALVVLYSLSALRDYRA